WRGLRGRLTRLNTPCRVSGDAAAIRVSRHAGTDCRHPEAMDGFEAYPRRHPGVGGGALPERSSGIRA
ncbi:MAG: hypothetical protein ACU83V_07910, partial [Gammaproteobacteria bacterium]